MRGNHVKEVKMNNTETISGVHLIWNKKYIKSCKPSTEK